MKAVFWVHSHITYLISLEIIRKYKFNDIVIYLSRGYSIPFDCECNNLKIYTAPFFRQKEGGDLVDKYNPLKTRRNVHACKKFYRETLDGDSFYLFIPTSFEHAIAILMDLSNCVTYHYIEEGTAAYTCDMFTEKKHFLYKMVSKLIYNVPVKSFYDINNKFKGTFSFSAKAFGWSFNNEVMKLSVNGLKQYSDSHLLVLGFLRDNLVDLESKYKVIRNYFETFGKVKVYYKFHPSSKMTPHKMSVIVDVFKTSNTVEFEEISEDTILEYSFANTNSIIYSVDGISSVQLYLSNLGCIIKELIIKSESVTEYIRSFEEIIDEKCMKLKR